MRDQKLCRALRNGFLLFYFFCPWLCLISFIKLFKKKCTILKYIWIKVFENFYLNGDIFIYVFYTVFFFSFDYGRTIIWFLFSFIFCVQQLSFGFFFFVSPFYLALIKFFLLTVVSPLDIVLPLLPLELPTCTTHKCGGSACINAWELIYNSIQCNYWHKGGMNESNPHFGQGGWRTPTRWGCIYFSRIYELYKYKFILLFFFMFLLKFFIRFNCRPLWLTKARIIC